MRTALLTLGVLLAGCTTTAADDGAAEAADGSCKGDNLQQFVGQTVSAELGAAAMKTSGAKTLRWGPPGAMMTMDFRTDRLTIAYDENSKVIQATCG